MHLQNSWNKYGEENFTINILEECPINLLDEREEYWIKKYDSIKNGYNQKTGGSRSCGYKMSEEAKIKMRENHSDVSGEKNPMFGKKIFDFMTDEEIARWRENNKNAHKKRKGTKGKKHTQETKDLLSKLAKERYEKYGSPLKGKKRPPEIREKFRKSLKHFYGAENKNARKIICLNTKEIFEYILAAANKYNISYTTISSCCNHKSGVLTAGKLDGIPLVWRYYEEYLENPNEDYQKIINRSLNGRGGGNNVNALKVKCVTTNEFFDCIMDAAKFYNIDNSSIAKCCKGLFKFCGKHPETKEKLIWEYVDKPCQIETNSMA